MDVNALRVSVTLLSFLAFAGIFVWAWRGKNLKGFSEAAQLPFVDSRPGGALQDADKVARHE